VRLLVERFPETARDLWTDEDTVEVQVSRESVVETLRTLRDDPEFGFFMLADAAAVDYGVGKHFEVVYHLYSEKHPAWLRLRVRVERANPRTPSVTGLWTGAMFHEREMYDMMGIVFEGNRDLRRIYMSPNYRSFPQRKDFILPDDAADSSAAGVNPLERPETWDLRPRSLVANVFGAGTPSGPRHVNPYLIRHRLLDAVRGSRDGRLAATVPLAKAHTLQRCAETVAARTAFTFERCGFGDLRIKDGFAESDALHSADEVEVHGVFQYIAARSGIKSLAHQSFFGVHAQH